MSSQRCPYVITRAWTHLERKMEWREDYCAARDYQIAPAVKEIASGVNDAEGCQS